MSGEHWCIKFSFKWCPSVVFVESTNMYSNDILTVQLKGHLAAHYVMWLNSPCLASFQLVTYSLFWRGRNSLWLNAMKMSTFVCLFVLDCTYQVIYLGLVKVYRKGFLAI